jgi:hypothetical protein
VRKRHSSIQSPCAYTGRKNDATTQSPNASRATGARAARSIAGSTMSVRLSLYVRTKLPTYTQPGESGRVRSLPKSKVRFFV